MKKKSYIYAVISCLCWGALAPVSKILFTGLSNMAVLGYGSAIGTLVLAGILTARGELGQIRDLNAGEAVRLLLLGTMGYFLYSVLYYRGITVLSSQTACILNYLWPLFTVLFSIPILGEKMTLPKAAAILLSFAGVMLVVLGGSSGAGQSSGSAMGVLCCILAAACYGLFNVLNKRLKGSQLLHMLFYIGIGAVLALVCHAAEGWSWPTPRQWLGLLWLGVFADSIAYLLWAMALECGNTAAVSNIAFTTPVISVLLSSLMLGEVMPHTALVGLVCILGGIILQSLLDQRSAVSE